MLVSNFTDTKRFQYFQIAMATNNMVNGTPIPSSFYIDRTADASPEKISGKYTLPARL